MGRRGGKRGNKNRVQNVRIADDYAGSDGLKFERQLSYLQNSHSITRVMCTGSYNINPSTTPGTVITANYSGATVRATDDWSSMAQQFNTARITAIRFDIYDINPNLSTAGFVSTFHDVNRTGGNYGQFTELQVLDSPDSQLVPAGTGRISLVWRAKGVTENNFESTTAAGFGDFGGLRVAILPAAAATEKYRVIMKALVDFRGRN